MQRVSWRCTLSGKIKTFRPDDFISDLINEDTAILHIRVADGDVHCATLAPCDNEAVELATLAGILLERALENEDDDLATMEIEGNA